MIILGRDKDKAVKRADLGGPYFGVRLTVLPIMGGTGFVEERQVEVFDVHEFELGIPTLLRDFVNPFGHGLAVATGSCASEDDCDLKHNFLLFALRCQLVRMTPPKGKPSTS